VPEKLWKFVVTAAILLCTISGRAQTNVYSLSVHTRWVVGSYPWKFGLQGYRKNAAGYYILAANGKPVGGLPSSNTIDYTGVNIGPIGFSVPLHLFVEAVFLVGILLTACWLLRAIYYRFHTSGDPAQSNAAAVNTDSTS
jgi:hypothetical protein